MVLPYYIFRVERRGGQPGAQARMGSPTRALFLRRAGATINFCVMLEPRSRMRRTDGASVGNIFLPVQ
jgi:hypothetical protein